jgi:hypothetical protein
MHRAVVCWSPVSAPVGEPVPGIHLADQLQKRPDGGFDLDRRLEAANACHCIGIARQRLIATGGPADQVEVAVILPCIVGVCGENGGDTTGDG